DSFVLLFKWNFHNGARMHEFESRRKELVALLYLPRTLQCLVGIGLDRGITRWPDPSAPKSTRLLVQADHRAGAEVGAMAYWDSHLVTGASDGEVVVWYMDSALVRSRMDIPANPRTGRRAGITKLAYADFGAGLVVLLAGTDDGSLHFLRPSSSECLLSLF